jgi:hypothetical protein
MKCPECGVRCKPGGARYFPNFGVTKGAVLGAGAGALMLYSGYGGPVSFWLLAIVGAIMGRPLFAYTQTEDDEWSLEG